MIETFASMNNTQLLVYGLIRYNIEPIHKCDNWISRIPSLNNIREVYHGHRYTRFNPELNSFIKLDEATPDLLAVSGNKFCEMQLKDLSDCFQVFDLKICDRGLPLMEPLANSGCLAHIFAKKIKKIRFYLLLKIKVIRFPFFSKFCVFNTKFRSGAIFEHLTEGNIIICLLSSLWYCETLNIFQECGMLLIRIQVNYICTALKTPVSMKFMEIHSFM